MVAESALMKRTFRTCGGDLGTDRAAVYREEKSRRQVLFSTDLITDVLRKHQAEPCYWRAARADAATGCSIQRLVICSPHSGANHHRELTMFRRWRCR